MSRYCIVTVITVACDHVSGLTETGSPVNGAASPQSNDVDVDGNGLIYLLDRDWGLDILEMKLP